MINARVDRGHTVLVTGIGGGVALVAMQLCLAKGANVFVTSGDETKIRRAIAMGARGGVNYRDSECRRVPRPSLKWMHRRGLAGEARRAVQGNAG